MWDGAAVWKGGNDSNSNIDNWEFITTGVVGSLVNAVKHYSGLGTLTIEWPQRHILSPEDVFTGNILITNINFFESYKNKESTIAQSNKGLLGQGLTWLGEKMGVQKDESENLEKLRNAIAKWYITIRNITIVGLLSVLVYIAIRMVISSASQDKAKYKSMLIDWLVSLVLVFTLHYIMAVTVGVCDKLTKLMNENINSGIYLEKGDKFEYNGKTYGSSESEGEALDNLVSKIRIYTQSANSTMALSYSLMYLAITVWTLIYFVIYMKRFVFMAFYTLMAPIVALTYPIDKIGDGRSQAFNSWLKEYIYNALKQPFHLLLYTVFIGMAQEIADSNFIYTFVILWAMMQLDGTLAKWIGVDQASSTGSSIKEGAKSLLALQGLTSLINGGDSSTSSSETSSTTATKSKPKVKGTNGLPQGTPIPGDTSSPSDNNGQQIRQANNIQNTNNPAQNNTGDSAGTNIPAQRQQTIDTGVNPKLASYEGSTRSNFRNKEAKKQKRKNSTLAKGINKVASHRASQRAGRMIRPLANGAGRVAKMAVVGTAMLAGAMTGGIEGAASFKGVADEFTGSVEKNVNKLKDKGSSYLNDYKNDYTQQLDKMSMASKEEKDAMDKEYADYGGRNSRAAAKMADLSGLDVLEDPKAVKQSLDIANQMMQQDSSLSPDEAMAATAEAHKYSDYSRKDDETVRKLINESGTAHAEEVYEAWKCLQDFTGQRKYSRDNFASVKNSQSQLNSGTMTGDGDGI